MKFIDNVSEKEYEEFVIKHEKSHFMQSYYFGLVMKNKNFKPHYVGLKKDNKLVATALILEKHLFNKYCYFYSPRGFVIDYENLELLSVFTKEIKRYMKEKHAIFLKIDPDLKRYDLDPDGNILSDENEVIEKLKKLNYKHLKYKDDFRSTEQPRFTFRLSLENSIENINQGMHATTRKILNKGNLYDLDLYIGNDEDIPLFMTTMKETAKREDIACGPESYYRSFYNILNSHGMSDLYVVKVNVLKLKKLYEERINSLEEKIKELDNLENKNVKKTENKKKEYENEINRYKKDKILIDEIKEEELVLSSIITVKYGNKVWTVHGGNSNELRFLNSNYYLYHQIIKDAHEDGYKLIDFFGTMGRNNINKNENIMGIHSFKKRLGGEYIEFVGEFVLIGNKLLYTLYNTLVPIRRKIVNFMLRRVKHD